MAEKIFTVDKFLGLNEAVDGTTELKMGEASKVENFYITDDYNLKNRPGVSIQSRLPLVPGDNNKYRGLWMGMIGNRLWRITINGADNADYLHVDLMTMDNRGEMLHSIYALICDAGKPVKVFPFRNKLYIYGSGWDSLLKMDCFLTVYSDPEGNLVLDEGAQRYTPCILSNCSPSGGGTELEPINILTDRVRVQFSGDGTSKIYKFPQMVSALVSVTVDGVTEEIGGYEPNTGYEFTSPPPKGENNIEFVCRIEDESHRLAGERFLQMRHYEAYNGSTDNRLFFYGDGTNICYYTGNPAFGEGLYIPAANEIAVDSSASALTGMRTQNTRLLAFKPDGAFSIDYEPMTLEDGKVIAGYYVYPVHRGIGNEMDGQVQTVNNYARTLCGGSLYEWRNSASYHKDERYAKQISDKVSKTLAAADPAKIVTCDDNATQTYYMFLNDEKGTVLVNRYAIDVWTIYTGKVFKGVQFAYASQNDVLFATTDTIYRFDTAETFDAPVEDGGEYTPIQCVWESGYMAFGADNKRKYSSDLWVSMLPEANSKMDVTVRTDRRDEYLEKATGLPLLDFSCIDFSNFSFLRRLAPQIKRIKIKVKKFVYYKLIFRVSQPGAKATVLGYDQQVRYSANVK